MIAEMVVRIRQMSAAEASALYNLIFNRQTSCTPSHAVCDPTSRITNIIYDRDYAVPEHASDRIQAGYARDADYPNQPKVNLIDCDVDRGYPVNFMYDTRPNPISI